MTLVLSLHSRDSLWVVVDRRLSYGGRRRPIDDAIKLMSLDTKDGVGLLAYAGLGATSRGTQPSAWMSAALRGHGDLTFEQALSVLSDAAARELPRHLRLMPRSVLGAHSIIVPAFVRGAGARVYTIDNLVDQQTRRHWYRYTRHANTALPGSPSPRLVLGGTGGIFLARKEDGWKRALLSLANAHDRARVSDLAIADRLAALNYKAHLAVRDGSVGPRCIVMWRRRPEAGHTAGGGAHQFYNGTDREPDAGVVPAIGNGLDITSIVTALVRHIEGPMASYLFNDGPPPVIDEEALRRSVAALPSKPDDALR